MTTGVPIYLVSACASGEEFVAAFRRYSDRGSLFVPIGEPLPPGRRGRIALTLGDGGVMLDGDVEIVSSSKTASILHGRVGMTIRFVDPDEPTKTLLLELDRARLAVRPSPPSVAARPAEVPAAPRPVPPAPAGRIDAASALAECVAIGDLASLREGSAPLKPGPKFVMPSIPGAGKKVPTIPPKLGTAVAEPIPVVAPVAPSRPFRLPTPPPEEPSDDGEAAQIVSLPPPKLPATATQPSAVVPMPTRQSRGDQSTIRGTKPASVRMTTLGMSAINPTPPMPMPVAPRPRTQDVVADEATDVNDLSDVRSTAPGVGAPPAHDTSVMESPPQPSIIGSLAIDAHARTISATPRFELPPADGDWTMAPSDPEPTPVPVEPRPLPAGPMTGNWTIALTPEGWGEVEKVAASLPAPGPRTAVSGETGPAVTSVTGEKPMQELRPEPEVSADEGKIQIDPTLMEPLQEMPPLDPTLLPAPPARPTPLPLPPAPQLAAYPEMMEPPPPQSYPTPLPLTPPPPPHGTGSNPVYPEPETRMFEDVGASQARMRQDPTAILKLKQRRRLVVIIASALAIAVIAIVVVVMARGSKKDAAVVEDAARPVVEHTMPVAPPVDAAAAAVAVDSKPVDVPVDAAAAADCTVEIITVPKEVEVAIDNTTKIGTAPGTVQLPCGAEVKLYLRKPGFSGVIKSITPTADMKPLRFFLARAVTTFTVRVSSAPAGATIWVGGKTMGVTPSIVHLNGPDPVVIQIAKEGYATQEQKLTPKPQTQVVHVKLVAKKKSR